MGTASDLALVSVDPGSGRSLVGSTESDAVFGGAILVDLARLERIEIVGSGSRARVRSRSAEPTGDRVLDDALVRIKPGSNRKAASVIPRLGKDARSRLLDQWADQGAVQVRRHRILGLIPITRHDMVDAARRDQLVHSVGAVLSGSTATDDATGVLIALLSAGNVIKRLAPAEDRKTAVNRAKEIAKGEWAGAASKAAIDAANAAVTAAVMAATAAASGGAAGS